MQFKDKIFKLLGKVQHYQWGGHQFLPTLLQQENKEQLPFAEYWLGAHNAASASLENGTLLKAYIQQHPEVLGDAVKEKFGCLPYLFKILDVKDMLSIQVHPTKASAIKGFEDENKRHIPLSSPQRNYKDNNHKPELMLALSHFWLLHGFKPKEEINKILQCIQPLHFLLPFFETQSYKGLYQKIMTMPQEEVNASLQPLLATIVPLYQNNQLNKTDPHFWAARAADTYTIHGNIDRGIFSIYVSNLVQLQPGETIFQEAGILHAYLEGQNIEIMANSDNVLRGGLTPKHINVSELMQHVLFEAITPTVIQAKNKNDIESVFETTAPDFQLSEINLYEGQQYEITTHTLDIFFLFSGKATVVSTKTSIALQAGKAIGAVANTCLIFTAEASTKLFRASVGSLVKNGQ
jgi:mannose-6-phosphate isomerase